MKNLSPRQAFDALQANPDAVMVDVRMEIETLYVGRPAGLPRPVVHVSWYEYPAFETDPAAFAKQVADEVGGKDVPVFLICRSGQRTVDAAKALEAAGFADVTNILHGFEGSLDENFHRSTLNGWRFDGLPWEQM
ncbi:MAG: hypothetical protein RLZZ271_1295 [Pseudomonadota bacterium]|jgi:rhodanese-related sulfurtransferase